MCLLGRAANIFPLALLCNKFREHKITKKMMFIMWFSGMFFQSKRCNNEIVIHINCAFGHPYLLLPVLVEFS